MAQRIITVPIVNQGNNDLLPFTLIAESGYSANNSALNFTIEAVSSEYLDYQAVISRDNSAVLSNVASQTVYVPENEETRYAHQSSFYVDIIGHDIGGIRDVRTHVEPYGYQFSEIGDDDKVFRIPKFTWENFLTQLVTTTTTTAFSNNSMWVGTSGNKLVHIRYSNVLNSIISTDDLEDPVDKVMFGVGNDRMYVSTPNHLYKYVVGYYTNVGGSSSSFEFNQELEVANPYRILMNSYKDDNDSVWGVESYYNKVVKLNPDTLSVIKEYTGIDAPFKIVYSAFHEAYFVAGSYMIWKIDDTAQTTSMVYEVNHYRVVDIDVSEDGKLCILLSGASDGYIRILDSDLFTFLLNEKVTPSILRYCAYCGEGKFYIISELNVGTGSPVYSAIHWIFNTSTKILSHFDSEDVLQTTTTTTTQGTTVNAVHIVSPNGGESLRVGRNYDIQWISSKSISDYVKIELYKAGGWYSTISEKTPNSGIFPWTISNSVEESEDYRIRITWLVANSDPGNSDLSDNSFSISESVQTTTTTTTTKITEESIGIAYDGLNDQVVIMLKSGWFMVFDMSTHFVYGLNNSGVLSPVCLAVKNTSISTLDKQTKVRIFVGSQEYASDRWDSGEIETELTSCYYGGGNDLAPGQTYYAHIQIYSKKFGWSEVQIKPFVMPK